MAPIHLPNGVKVHEPTGSRRAYRIVWYAHDGRRKNLWRVNRDDAFEVGHELARQLEHPPDESKPHHHQTVGTMLDAYAEDGPAVKTRTTRRSLTRLVPSDLLGYVASAVTADHLRQHVDKLETVEHRRRVYTHLHAAYEWGIDRGYCDENPVPKPPKKQRVRQQGQTVHYVSDDEIPSTTQVEDLADAAERISGQAYATAVRVSAYAGLRIGEVAGLAWDKVEVGCGAIHVHRQYLVDDGTRQPHLHLPKRGKKRTTVLPSFMDDEMSELLNSMVGPAPPHPCPTGCPEATDMTPYTRPLWPDERKVGTGWNPSSRLYCWFCDWRAAAGWPTGPNGKFKWNWHSLRHHFCTWALASPEGERIRDRIPPGLGLEVADVAHFAGHGSPSFTYEAYCATRQGAVVRGRQATL